MSDELEIDLRPYIQMLFRYWYFVIFIPVLAGAATYVYLRMQPPFYEATAIVAITEADFLVNYGSSIETTDEGRPAYQGLPSFATSSDIIAQVYNAFDPKPENIVSIEKLADRLEADSGNDLRLLFLTAKMPTPDDAARAANIWADIFINQAHRVYGQTDEEEVAFYKDQVSANLADLDISEKALIDFQSRNELAILRDQFTVIKERHAENLRQLENIDIIIQDLEGLRTKLSPRNRSAKANIADQLSLFSLQSAAFNAGEGLGVLIQFDDNVIFAEETVAQQLDTLDDLIAILDEKKLLTNEKIATIQPMIKTLQTDILKLDLEQAQLNRTLELQRFLDTTLTRKYEEVKLSSVQSPNAFRNAGQAIPPIEPAGPKKLMPTAVVTVVTGMLVVGVLVFIKYWKSGELNELLPGSEHKKNVDA